MTKKLILLIDDDADFVRALAMRCESIGLEVLHAHNLLSATLIATKQVPDLICADVDLPTGNGLAFCDSLASDPTTAHIPLIVLSGRTCPETLQACEHMHAHFVLKSPNYWSLLEPVIRQLVAQASASPNSSTSRSRSTDKDNDATPTPKTLMVWPAPTANARQVIVADDDEDILTLLSQRFSALNCKVFGVDNALDTINLIHRISPDLVCLDVGMPSGNGLSICEMMASDEALRKIPVIVLTGRSDESTIRRCHDMLVYYVQKSADTWQRIEPLARELLHLEESAAPSPDPLQPPTPTKQITSEPKPQEPIVTAQTNSPTTICPMSITQDNRDVLLDAVFAALGADTKQSSEIVNSPDASRAATETVDIPWVLSIDDDAEFSDALRIRLEQHGVAVRRAFNGMEGYRLAFTSPASAILLDYNMPNGQGDYVLGRLKDNPVTSAIPVIVITGSRDKVLERRMLSMGAAAFLEKPISFDRLRQELSKHIDILDKPCPAKQTASPEATRLTFTHVSP